MLATCDGTGLQGEFSFASRLTRSDRTPPVVSFVRYSGLKSSAEVLF